MKKKAGIYCLFVTVLTMLLMTEGKPNKEEKDIELYNKNKIGQNIAREIDLKIREKEHSEKNDQNQNIKDYLYDLLWYRELLVDPRFSKILIDIVDSSDRFIPVNAILNIYASPDEKTQIINIQNLLSMYVNYSDNIEIDGETYLELDNIKVLDNREGILDIPKQIYFLYNSRSYKKYKSYYHYDDKDDIINIIVDDNDNIIAYIKDHIDRENFEDYYSCKVVDEMYKVSTLKDALEKYNLNDDISSLYTYTELDETLKKLTDEIKIVDEQKVLKKTMN